MTDGQWDINSEQDIDELVTEYKKKDENRAIMEKVMANMLIIRF